MGKHIEDIHAFPLPLLHPRRQAGVKLLSCLASLGGGLVTPAKSTGRRPKRGVGGAWSKVGSFSTLGCFVWMWACSGTFIGAEHTVGTSRWNSSGRAGDDPGWFYREWIVLIAPGKDREAWVNHVHPPWWSCLGHAVFACTIIRHGSIFKWTTVGTGNPAWITQLSHENLQVTHLQTPSYWCWPTPLTWAGVSSCCGCPAVMPGRAELKNEGLSGSLTPPGPALSLLLCQEK